jgi:hypothetical protein
MKLDFENLLTEREFAEIKQRVERFDIFEFVKHDKANHIELQIDGRHYDNGIWQDNYLCSVGGSENWGGFGRPYQRAEFLKLTYADVAKAFACYGYKVSSIRQLDMFALAFGGGKE